MFSYYGSKSKIVDYYPSPKHKRIIEPFAGSARYALKYWQNDVLLVDKYEIVVNMWKWLKSCSEKDILGLPEYNPKEPFSNTLSENERMMVAFNCNRGGATPKNVAGGYDNVLSVWKYRKKEIAKSLFKIRHWEVRLSSYDEIENEEATWFIDPPYQFGGEHYKESNKNLNFTELAEWCKSRIGQTIVCENTKANWLPFKKMIDISGQSQKTTEAIWSNNITNYDNVQMSLL